MFYIGFYRDKHGKIFLSETVRSRALIFGMKHYLVNLYHVCSNYAPGAKSGNALGSHVLNRLIEGKQEKIFLSETIWPSVLIFGM